MNPSAVDHAIEPWRFDQYVAAEAYEEATPDELAALEADVHQWHASLVRQHREAKDNLASARSGDLGEERDQVLADLESELRVFSEALTRHPAEKSRRREPAPREEVPAQPVQLQVSWQPGRVVAWAAGFKNEPESREQVIARLVAARAQESLFKPHAPVPLPGGGHADAVEVPVGEILGLLVAAGADELGEEIGPSLQWLGRVAIWAVELAANGSMVPILRRRTRRSSGARESSGSYAVRWTPALLDSSRLARLAKSMPGAVAAVDRKVDARALTRSALTGMVDAIVRKGARGIEVPAPPPRVRNANDLGEAVLARLDGTAFDAPRNVGDDVIGKIERWARAVTGEHTPLIVQLDPPDARDTWHLSVFATESRRTPIEIERAIVMAGSNRAHLESELARLERMVPALLRPGGTRRGEVILSPDEAWELMSTTGPRLATAGFDVRVPEFGKKKGKPALRVFVEDANESMVGASQLANVTWSAVFDGVELSAEEIAQLAKDARPLIHSGGRWVALDRADLKAAAEALAERAQRKQMTGAEMLRLALGLEASPLGGGTLVEGGGWAADILAAARRIADEPAKVAKGFAGKLRSYQAEALAWLGFLDEASLGGCLALDMGLGKTPTLLAHLLDTKQQGPALVIAPPAVVGNWMAEAGRFTPKLNVAVHHGVNRAAGGEIANAVAKADVIITTYGTAVRDIEELAEIEWSKVVLDEAQAIKNPANDTAQQLRKLNARTRVALTGTPIENGLGDLWAILDFLNPGLVGGRPQFIAALSSDGEAKRVNGEDAMRALNGILVFRRTKAEPEIAAELPDQIDEVDHCAMTPEQIGMYQALLDEVVIQAEQDDDNDRRKGQILAAITGLKQICNHPWNYQQDDEPLDGRSGKLARLEEIIEAVFAAGERVLVFTHFATWGVRLAEHLTEKTGTKVECYHGGLSRTARDKIIADFHEQDGPGVLVLSLKAGGTGLNLTAASHVVLYDRWWNPAVEDQARDRAWRIGQTRTVICHRLICPGTVDERVEEVVAGKRRIADLVLPKSSSLADLDSEQLRRALGLRPDTLLSEDEIAERV